MLIYNNNVPRNLNPHLLKSFLLQAYRDNMGQALSNTITMVPGAGVLGGRKQRTSLLLNVLNANRVDAFGYAAERAARRHGGPASK